MWGPTLAERNQGKGRDQIGELFRYTRSGAKYEYEYVLIAIKLFSLSSLRVFALTLSPQLMTGEKHKHRVIYYKINGIKHKQKLPLLQIKVT